MMMRKLTVLLLMERRRRGVDGVRRELDVTVERSGDADARSVVGESYVSCELTLK
jgi:hypothetical protein